MRFLFRRWKTLGLLLAGAWMPATITCGGPGVRIFGPPVYVEDYPADIVVVDEGPYYVDEGWGFDFFYY